MAYFIVAENIVSWAAWPRADQHHMTTDEDVEYQRELRGKTFMAGVSPWFYTSMLPPLGCSCPKQADQCSGLPQWEKNWLSASEKLWYDRWIHMLELRPDFVQIITCRFPLLQAWVGTFTLCLILAHNRERLW